MPVPYIGNVIVIQRDWENVESTDYSRALEAVDEFLTMV
jgi:hypothetical protein